MRSISGTFGAEVDPETHLYNWNTGNNGINRREGPDLQWDQS